MQSLTDKRRYRFGFVLTTAAGNLTRYLNLRKYADRDPEVECVWAPVKHYEDDPNFLARVPGPLRTRMIVRHQASPVMRQFARLDAVMFHLFEPYALACARRVFRKRPVVVWSQDNPPLGDPALHPDYGGEKSRMGWRRTLRFRLDVACARRTDLFLPFSQWAGSLLIEECGVPVERVKVAHVGLDLELWPHLLMPDAPQGLPKILFVGGDFERKGGDLLLDVFRRELVGKAELHLVTKRPPPDLPPGVTVHTDLSANDARLRQLYSDCAVFALPTRADVVPWVVLEAMATGRPVISTPIAGIPDMLRDGETGFMTPAGDGAALADRLNLLLTDVRLRRCMGEAGRRVVERDFNAAVCVPRILHAMKEAARRT